MFSKGVEFTFEFDPSDDEVRRTIRDSRCMLKCDACGDAAVVAAARALAAAYDAALAAEGRRARAPPPPPPPPPPARPGAPPLFWGAGPPPGGGPAPGPRGRGGGRAAETCVEGYAPGAGGW